MCMAIRCSYKDRRAVAVGELLKCFKEPTNVSTRYAAAVIKKGMTISHFPSTKKNFRTRIIFK